jgi:dolichyl-phosphate beta-glucosyltransferase
MNKDFISVVIPAFNEANRLPPTIRKIWEYLNKNFNEFEIIVVDDGSRDSTASEVESLIKTMKGIKLLRNNTNMGKGYSIKRGILASSGDSILMTDADLSTPIEELEKLSEWINRGFDIVIGSRGLKDSDIAIRQSWYREKMGKIFNLLVRAVVIGDFKDTQCGFKLFRGSVAKEVFKKSIINGFSFDVEILSIASRSGFSIKEVPVRWLNSPRSTVSIFRDPLIMFFDLVRIRLNHMLNIYNIKSRLE